MSFAEMDMSALRPQKKRAHDGTMDVAVVRYEDYKFPEHSTQGGKRLKLPPLLKPIPREILARVVNGKRKSGVQQVSELADKLKRSAAKHFSVENYENALLDFTQSLTLFTLALRMKEKKCKETGAKLMHKVGDWRKVSDFGDKIITNFSKVLQKVKMENIRKFNRYSHIMGVIYFTCGLLRNHIADMIRVQLREARKMGLKERDLVSNFLKELDSNIDTAREYFQDGERRIGIFIIMQGYSEVWSRSLQKLSLVNRENIIIAHSISGIDIDDKELPHGVNFCLPVSLHSWDLDNMINFTGWFVKEWGKGMEGVIL